MNHWLTSERAPSFAHLTTPTLAQAFNGLVCPDDLNMTTGEALMAVGGSFAGLPAALAVVSLTPNSVLEVISLAVAEPFRRVGIARQLLNWLQGEAQRLGLQTLSLSYPLAHASTVAMECLTRGWRHSPGLRLVHLDREGAEALVQRLTPAAHRWLGSGRFALVRWQAMGPEHRRSLERRQQQAPAWTWTVSPVGSLGQRDPVISQVLLDRDAVVGWLVAHRVGSCLFRVTQWWVAPEWQGGGLALVLLRQAVADALEALPIYHSGCFGVGATSEEMLLLCRRHLEPLASSVMTNQRATWLCTQTSKMGLSDS